MTEQAVVSKGVLTAQCCVTGGGPAGVMLGYLLARAGVDVIVLEKHADFFRDFRGDTIHPSTLRIMDELGLLDDFLKLPHSEVRELTGRIGATTLTAATFSHVPGRCKFVAFMPQWDFLNFLSARAQKFPTFRLMMNTEATDLIVENGRVAGVKATSPDGALEVRADLVVAADGRHSTLRERANLQVIDTGAPIDVLWMRVSRKPNDPGETFGNVAGGGILVALPRNDYYQCAFVIRKGGFEAIKARGIEAFRTDVGRLAPYLADRTDEIKTWDDVKLLTVVVDHLATWYRPGLLCIGDAAHAMSPVGGVGINLAIQDAVATANILAGSLRAGASITPGQLQAVQTRRELPARLTQRLQVLIQNRVLNAVLSTQNLPKAPALVQWIFSIPFLRTIPAYVIGIGFRPEHVHTPAVAVSATQRSAGQ
jgi:2-polyprenyl-6-methoxyphenol hydroxylase-like FAD-dependent oxidoreductase